MIDDQEVNYDHDALQAIGCWNSIPLLSLILWRFPHGE